MLRKSPFLLEILTPSFLLSCYFFISSSSWMYEQWMLPNTYTFPLYSPWSNISIQLQDLLTLGKKRPQVSKKSALAEASSSECPRHRGAQPFLGWTAPNPAHLGEASVWAPFLQMTPVFPSWLPQENNIAVNRLLKIFFKCLSLNGRLKRMKIQKL